MRDIARKFRLGFTVAIMAVAYTAGVALSPVVLAGEIRLEISHLELVPTNVLVNQPFDFRVSFIVKDPEMQGREIEATLQFEILKRSKTRFTSNSYSVTAYNGEEKTWVMHMNPVVAKGEYTIDANVNYGKLTADKSIKLTIGISPEAIEKAPQEVSEPIVLLGQSPPTVTQENVVHIRHILLKTKVDALRVLGGMEGLSGNQLKQKFIADAKARSVGPTGQFGGDLGFIKRGQMVAAFENAAFSISPGTITSTPVKTVYGYHIIYREQ